MGSDVRDGVKNSDGRQWAMASGGWGNVVGFLPNTTEWLPSEIKDHPENESAGN